MSNSPKRRLARTAIMGMALAAPMIAIGASQPATAAGKSKMHKSIRTMDKSLLLKSQRQRLHGRSQGQRFQGRQPSGAGEFNDLDDVIDWSTLSCPTKCLHSCPD